MGSRYFDARPQVSPQRRAVFYAGLALVGVGVILFSSTFVSFAHTFANMFNFDNADPEEKFKQFGKSGASMFLRAFLGSSFMTLGAIIALVARAGLAGSGLKLDPLKARRDLEPFSRQAGGMFKDAMDEAGVRLSRDGSAPLVKVRCRACKNLNDEHAKFCQQCGLETGA